MATSTSRIDGSRSSGQGAGDELSIGGNSSPVAARHLLLATSPTARAAAPSTAVVASCQGPYRLPFGVVRRSSSRCPEVSHRSTVMSMPPQKTRASSMTTIFWWWAAPMGWAASSCRCSRSLVM